MSISESRRTRVDRVKPRAFAYLSLSNKLVNRVNHLVWRCKSHKTCVLCWSVFAICYVHASYFFSQIWKTIHKYVNGAIQILYAGNQKYKLQSFEQGNKLKWVAVVNHGIEAHLGMVLKWTTKFWWSTIEHADSRW